MDPDRLFCHTVNDLAARADSDDEYEVLASSALVRKLLIDKSRLHTPRQPFAPAHDPLHVQRTDPVRRRGVAPRRPVFWSVQDGLKPKQVGPPGLVNPVVGKLDSDFWRGTSCELEGMMCPFVT